jgi:hypothetical protein
VSPELKEGRKMWKRRSAHVPILAFLAAGFGFALLAQAGPEAKPKPQGPYMGQTLPGTTPEVFAPGFISKPGKSEYGCTFFPDGNEFYFSRDGNTWFTILQADGWSKPKKAPWNTASVDMEPHVTADGSKLLYSSNRPEGSQPSGIWVLDREGTGWGRPRHLGPGMYPTTAQNGNLYITDIHVPGEERIGVRRFEDGQYGPLEMLDEGVNDGTPAIHPCISWDESFLIFDGPRPDALGGPGDSDFYISFRNPDGSWSPAAHFLEISSTKGDMTASLSPDGKYIFFFQHGDLWWVSAEIVERYRPKA